MQNRNIDFYIDRAKNNQGLPSDLKLGQMLGYKGSFVSFLRKRKTLPSPEKMVELAKLADIDPAVALMDLAMWTSEGEAKKTYATILQKITAMVALTIGVTAVTPSAAMASTGLITAAALFPTVNGLICYSILWKFMGLVDLSSDTTPYRYNIGSKRTKEQKRP